MIFFDLYTTVTFQYEENNIILGYVKPLLTHFSFPNTQKIDMEYSDIL